MKELQLTLPAHWASYMINADPTSYDLTDQDIRDADEICSYFGQPVDCSDTPEFTHYWNMDYPCKLHGDALTYTFLVDENL